jgi:thiosulfate sulfurtransferase
MPDFKTISVTDAKALLELGNTQIIDIRDDASFQQAHIAGAQRIGNDNIDGFIAAGDKSQPLIVCCYHGISSQHAAQFLAEQGFGDVYSLSGGFEHWRNEFPVEN